MRTRPRRTLGKSTSRLDPRGWHGRAHITGASKVRRSSRCAASRRRADAGHAARQGVCTGWALRHPRECRATSSIVFSARRLTRRDPGISRRRAARAGSSKRHEVQRHGSPHPSVSERSSAGVGGRNAGPVGWRPYWRASQRVRAVSSGRAARVGWGVRGLIGTGQRAIGTGQRARCPPSDSQPDAASRSTHPASPECAGGTLAAISRISRA